MEGKVPPGAALFAGAGEPDGENPVAVRQRGDIPLEPRRAAVTGMDVHIEMRFDNGPREEHASENTFA